MKNETMDIAAAESVALRAIEFLAGDEERLVRFLSLTGVGPQELAAGIGDPGFLSGVLDHVMTDETLLFLFCDHAGLAPDIPGRAGRLLAAATGTAGAP